MIYILLADGFEEIEALTVVDVLRRAELNIKMVSVNNEEFVRGAHDIIVKTDCNIEDVNKHDIQMIVLPGGMPGTKNLNGNNKVTELLKFCVENDLWISAICAAPMVLGNKGYLKGKEAICFPGFEKYLEDAIIRDSKVVVSDKFITSKGAGTAFDFAVTIVSLLKDENLAHTLRIQMQYQ